MKRTAEICLFFLFLILIGCEPSSKNQSTSPENFRIPAEFEPVNSVLLGWKTYPDTLTALTKIITVHGKVQVFAAEGPSKIEGVSEKYYRSLDCPVNSVWIRDYGPITLTKNNGQKAFIDPIYTNFGKRRHDDNFPSCLAATLSSSAPNRKIDNYFLDLFMDGGNILLDGKGNLFMSKAIYRWNENRSRETVDSMLKEHFKAHTIHALDYPGYPGFPADGTGHIDMFLKLLSVDTVLISRSDQWPYSEAFEKAVEYFSDLTAPNGLPYRILRINGYEVDRTWYTYTNSILVNGMVLMPVYENLDEDNTEAERIYLEALGKNTKLFKINSDKLIKGGGALHCIIQQIP